MISCASSTMSTTWENRAVSKLPSGRRNFIRFSDARLHAESSTCMYSEHGLDALIRPEFGDVCHWLIVVSYWTACMNSSVTRTELLAFWYWIEWKPSPSIDMSNPASRSAAALSSSLALHQMKSRMSGWSTSSTTIFAARRVLPPDLIVPAHESAPRMNDTGPDAVPPFASGSIDPRMFDRLMPDPEPPRKIRPSLVFQSRIDSIVSSTDRMKQAEHCGFSSKPTLNHTGELKAAIWWSRMYVSSASNASPSSGVAK